MNDMKNWTRAGFRTVVALAMAAGTMAMAQQPSTFATGLQFPSKIILGPNGNLLVTETGSDPNSGRISAINSSGTRRTLIGGRPSRTPWELLLRYSLRF